jgi:hypothetical protein
MYEKRKQRAAGDRGRHGVRADHFCGSGFNTWCVHSALMATLLIVVGCGGPAYEYDSIVTGTVTVDGELATAGTVTFHPVKDGIPAVGRIHPDGSYSLRTGQGNLRESDGGTVIPGEYLVTVSVTAPPVDGAVIGEGGPPIPGPSLISRRYAQKETTDLRLTVKAGPQVIVLNLDPAEPAPPPVQETADATSTLDSEGDDQSNDVDTSAESVVDEASEEQVGPSTETPAVDSSEAIMTPTENPDERPAEAKAE